MPSGRRLEAGATPARGRGWAGVPDGTRCGLLMVAAAALPALGGQAAVAAATLGADATHESGKSPESASSQT